MPFLLLLYFTYDGLILFLVFLASLYFFTFVTLRDAFVSLFLQDLAYVALILFLILFFLLLHFFDLVILRYMFVASYTLLRIFTVFVLLIFPYLLFHIIGILSACAASIFTRIA